MNANPQPHTTPQLCSRGFSQNKRTNRRSQSKWRTERQGGRFGKTKHKEINNNATNNIEQQCGCIRKLLPRQESASPPDDYQASGQRKADRQSQRRSWYPLGGDEAKRGGQPIVRSEEQCAERHLIRRGAGWRAGDRWPDRRPYGGTQRYGHTGSDEKLAGCAVLQQRVCGPAETTARCLGPDLQWSQSVRGFRDWFRRKSHRDTSRVPREHLGRQHHRDIHQQRRVLWYQDKSVQISSAISPDDRCERPDQGQYIISRQHRWKYRVWIIRKQFRRDYFPWDNWTVDGSVRTGIVQCRLPACSDRRWYVPPGFRSRQYLFDGDQSAFRNRTDRGCRYRSRECEPGEVFNSHPGIRSDGGSGQLDQRYRPDASPVRGALASSTYFSGQNDRPPSRVNLQKSMLSQITIHTGPRLPQPLWAVRAAWKPPGKTKHKEIIQCP